jgi:glycine/D-amino acid oxidase-like deaminating enzyme
MAAGAATYTGQPNRSPWIVQLAEDGPPQPLARDTTVEHVVVGAGIAGLATAYFALQANIGRVMLLERDRVARGASGRNAGQLTTYFERPLCGIADEFGWELAGAAQQDVEGANDLLDQMIAETGAEVRVERFHGHMGMFSKNHLEVHLRCMAIRERVGLPQQECVVSEDAEYLADIPPQFTSLYSVVPPARVRELLELDDDRYSAVLTAPAGAANCGLLCQLVLSHLLRMYGERFVYADCTKVDRVVLDDERAVVYAGGHRVTSGSVALCTNGYVDHQVEDASGGAVQLAPHQRVTGRVGYMSAFVEEEMRTPAAISYVNNATIGGDTVSGDIPYAYVTRRTYDLAGEDVTLTCMGGPDLGFQGEAYRAEAPVPAEVLDAIDAEVRPFAQPLRPAGRPYDFHWHGLMGYNESLVRVIGPHPRHPRLLYNLGCNGVGFLASIHGGQRLARTLTGDPPPASIFDPR